MRTSSPLLSPSSGYKTANFQTPSNIKHSSQHSTVGTPNKSHQRNIINLKSASFHYSPQPFDTSRPKITSNYFNQQIITKNHSRYESPFKILLKNGYDYQEEIKQLKKENQDLHTIVKLQREQLQQTQLDPQLMEENQMLKEIIQRLQKENDEYKRQLNK
ncbi:unnamed protein product (macronuclear) [Paramecium tetraurelia]|uniref:Uncharacterized protein n=1 Tax=Paramecium tetraurelia TaxID=5888 RepID=A0CN17_PARTE|nr:uncharacterized protein GSPATT00008625001 [Paramecium tetraurelia]CAK72184.1 unnamed protein product [Paramecium tetraurelia]|eukprot:XP_001439581.1 hypothetical protein (macronuclear) [Paramecium tetraurelia strain d4-2]